MNTITVYGNEVDDIVIELKDFPKENLSHEILCSYNQMGGTANFIRALYKGLYIRKVTTKSDAIIIINNKTGSRTSLVNWKHSYLMQEDIKPTEWLHIMYLDKLESLNTRIISKFKEKSKIISADLCLDKQKDYNLKRMANVFPFIDYLIISDVEAECVTNILSKSKNTVIHSPTGTFLNGDFVKNIYYNERVFNTLGAGDTYAATFVSNIMMGIDAVKAIHMAHKVSSKFVLGDLK